MLKRTMGMTALAALLALPVAAQESGRYQLERGEDGFVRLDTYTGQMSFCREQRSELSCEAASDDMADLRAELDEVTAERDQLRDELDDIRDVAYDYDGYPSEELPSEEEIEEVADWFQTLLVIMARTMRDTEEELEEIERERDQSR